jgi:hypothetical protein
MRSCARSRPNHWLHAKLLAPGIGGVPKRPFDVIGIRCVYGRPVALGAVDESHIVAHGARRSATTGGGSISRLTACAASSASSAVRRVPSPPVHQLLRQDAAHDRIADVSAGIAAVHVESIEAILGMSWRGVCLKAKQQFDPTRGQPHELSPHGCAACKLGDGCRRREEAHHLRVHKSDEWAGISPRSGSVTSTTLDTLDHGYCGRL